MAIIANRNNLNILMSADISETQLFPSRYPLIDFLVLRSKETTLTDSDLATIIAIPRKYRKIVNEKIVLMNGSERTLVESSLVIKAKDSLTAQTEIGVLKPLIAGIVSVINLRLPADQQITGAEIKAAIRSAL